MQNLHVANSDKPVPFYSLDVIISVGYRVKSPNGIIFRKWATSILKDYMIKGYSINQKRLDALNKTIEIQSRMLASSLDIDAKEVLSVIETYSNALSLLDDYDHRTISKPKGKNSIYQLTYKECKDLIDSMKFNSSVFGEEKKPTNTALNCFIKKYVPKNLRCKLLKMDFQLLFINYFHIKS